MTHISQEERIDALENGQKVLQTGQDNIIKDQGEILKLLRPISETYVTVSKLGKWMMALLVFISILLGILVGIKSLVHSVISNIK